MNKDAWNDFISLKNPLLISCFKSLNHALEHFAKRRKEGDRRFCIIEIDQSVELFFKAILFKKGIRPFEKSFQTLLREVKPIVSMTQKEELDISTLHDDRNACQHEGKIPGTDQTEYLVHSTTRFLLSKAEVIFGINPEQLTEQVPTLLTMGSKEAEIGRIPEKPDILKSLEDGARLLFVLANSNLAFNQIAHALGRLIDIIYEDADGPPLYGYSIEPPHERVSDFDPAQYLQKQLRTLIPALALELKRVNIRFSKIPFDVDVEVNLIPMSIYALKELEYLKQEGFTEDEFFTRSLRLLRLQLLHDLLPQLDVKTCRQLKKQFRLLLRPSYVYHEFFFVRNSIMANPKIVALITNYFQEFNKALFKGLEPDDAP